MRRRRRDEAGAILVLTSILALTLLTFTAYSVDIGHESAVKRHLHVVADTAAQDALYALGSANALTLAANYATASAVANGHPLTGANQLTVEIGQWTGTPRAFQSLSPACVVTLPATVPACANAASANAVRVVAISNVIWNFVSGRQGLSATAVANPQGWTGLEIGTYDASASLTAGQIGFLNSELGISAVSYDGLAGASIKLSDLAAQLGFGSVNSMLTGTTTYGSLLSAGARALTNSGDTTSAASLTGIASALAAAGGSGNVRSGSTLSLGKFLNPLATTNGAGSFGQGSLLAGSGGVDALGLVTGGLDAALLNGTSFASFNGVNLAIANVTSLDAGVKVLSAPSWNFGPQCNATTQEPAAPSGCADVRTAQIEGQVVAHLAPLTVPILGIGTATITANIPLYFDNAAAHAWISSVNCAGPSDHQSSADAWAKTGVAHLAIGQNAGITAATNQQDLSNGTAGSVGIVGPDGTSVTVSGATFAEISIPALGLDVKVANNGTVTVLSAGPSLLQPTSPPPNPAVPSYSGPFLKPPAEVGLSTGALGYRGPDKIATATFSTGPGVTAVTSTGNGLQDALNSLAGSLPSLSASLSAGLGTSGLPVVTQTTVSTALSVSLGQEATTINSVISGIGQSVLGPLSGAFQADVGGAAVTNLAARNLTAPDGTICVPTVVQ